MNLGSHVAQASSLQVRAAALPPKCAAGKDARKTGQPGWLRYGRTVHEKERFAISALKRHDS